MKKSSKTEEDIANKLKIDEDIANKLELNFSKRGRRKRIKKIIFFLILLGAIGGGYYKYTQQAKTPEKIKYITQEAVLGEMLLHVTATGTLEPTNQVDVGSELSGIIRTLNVDYNDIVEKDQVLAILDTEKLKAHVTQCRASLASAKASVLRAEATLKEKDLELRRLRALIKSKITSETEINSAEAAFERAKAEKVAAEASVMQAEATLESQETDLKKAVIRSPIRGIVLTRSIEIGQTVAASFQAPVLFTLAEDLKKMELHVDIDEADIGKITEGQKSTFTVDAFPKRKFEGEIIQIRYGAETVNGVVTYKTILRVENNDLLLRPGMTANIEITVRHDQDVLLVPVAALRFMPPVVEKTEEKKGGILDSLMPRHPRRRGSATNTEVQRNTEGQRCVYALENDELKEYWVTVGDSTGNMVEILEGNIKPGMKLVTDIDSNNNRKRNR
ncbi:MAG: efflux RND transporter periplasmic adaptor subunit [Planctomycetes bacterium]|nr:efflux RND transporter periplasmic adaptor subunit [Planctomycetota bacterium]HPY75164.1 efflux RND transporter periplasmic adaptor subunit [Planctomycetota bacterium]HQB00771.1 efflux RND transporter periplasmic adaptor subunit [Planctomycetota bacterium]